MMRKEIYSYTLPKELNILFLVAPLVLLLFTIIFYFKQSTIAAAVFFVLTLAMIVGSTYKRSIYFDSQQNSLSIEKKYLTKTVSSNTIQIVSDSQLKLFTEKHKGRNSMGYTEVSGFLTLAITGKTSDTQLVEQVLCSEYRSDKKSQFLSRAKDISTIIDVQIIES